VRPEGPMLKAGKAERGTVFFGTGGSGICTFWGVEGGHNFSWGH